MRLLILGSALLVSLATAPSAMAWTWPLGGPVLRPYSLGPDAYAAGQHRGVDVAGADGELVRAPDSGTVSFVGVVPSSGKTVTIQHDGYAVSLTHLGTTSIGKGASVLEGDPIGTAGMSGETEWPVPYVHLGVRVSSAADGYVDPLTLLPPRPVTPPPATPPDTSVPATVPAISLGSDVPGSNAPVVRAEPPAPQVESPTPELRTTDPGSVESRHVSQAPAQKQGASAPSLPKPVGTTVDPVPVSASGQVTGATTVPIAIHAAAPTVRDAHAGEEVIGAALPGRASAPAAPTEPTGSGSQTRPTIGTAAPEVRPGLPAASTAPNAVQPVSAPGAPAATSTKMGEGGALVDGIRAGSSPVTSIRVEPNASHPAVGQDVLAVPPAQPTTAGRRRDDGRSGGSAGTTPDRHQPLAAEGRDRMPTLAVRDAQPVARVRIWLTTALLLLLAAVAGGRWLQARRGGLVRRGALLPHDVRVP